MLSLLIARRRVSLDAVLEAADAHGRHLVDPVLPDPLAPPRTSFDSSTPGLRPSLTTLRPRQRLRAARHMLPVLRDVSAGARMYDRSPEPTRHEIDATTLDDVVGRARALGVRDLGYARIPRVARRLAGDLRAQGFSAYPGTALGGTTAYVQLAELAGLGAIGYHGLSITPGEGARVRIGVVYTNVANLPFERPNPHAWVREFCAMCRTCVRACPVGAINDEPQARPAGFRAIDHAVCRDYFLEDFGCGVCLAVCPFSQAGYPAIQARFKGNPSAPTFEVVAAAPVRA